VVAENIEAGELSVAGWRSDWMDGFQKTPGRIMWASTPTARCWTCAATRLPTLAWTAPSAVAAPSRHSQDQRRHQQAPGEGPRHHNRQSHCGSPIWPERLPGSEPPRCRPKGADVPAVFGALL